MRICVGIPVVGAVHSSVYFSHLASMVTLGRVGQIIIPSCFDVFPHDRAREMIFDQAVEHGCDYLYFLDSDMRCQADDALRLLEVLRHSQEKDESVVMTTGYAYRRGYPYTSVWTKKFGDEVTQVIADENVSPTEIDSCGLACNMIDVGWVIKNIPKPRFSIEKVQGKDGQRVTIWEDMYFTNAIREAGGKIIGVPQVRPGHLDGGMMINDETVVWLRKCFLESTRQSQTGISQMPKIGN